MGDLKSVKVAYRRFCTLFKPQIQLSHQNLLKVFFLSLRGGLSRSHFCLPVGPSLRDSSRVSFLHREDDSLMVLMLQRIWHHGSTDNLRLRMN
jgi:hypothetical protein